MNRIDRRRIAGLLVAACAVLVIGCGEEDKTLQGAINRANDADRRVVSLEAELKKQKEDCDGRVAQVKGEAEKSFAALSKQLKEIQDVADGNVKRARADADQQVSSLKADVDRLRRELSDLDARAKKSLVAANELHEKSVAERDKENARLQVALGLEKTLRAAAESTLAAGPRHDQAKRARFDSERWVWCVLLLTAIVVGFAMLSRIRSLQDQLNSLVTSSVAEMVRLGVK